MTFCTFQQSFRNPAGKFWNCFWLKCLGGKTTSIRGVMFQRITICDSRVRYLKDLASRACKCFSDFFTENEVMSSLFYINMRTSTVPLSPIIIPRLVVSGAGGESPDISVNLQVFHVSESRQYWSEVPTETIVRTLLWICLDWRGLSQ